MDFLTFKEQLLNDDLKSLTTPEKLQECLGKKYPDIDIIGTFKLNASHIGIYFKHKLWEKLAIFRGEDWIETRVKSLKNKLPDETQAKLLKTLKKKITIINLESVIPINETFYFYIISKIAGKKHILHVSREGDVLLKSKFMDYSIRLKNDDDDSDDDAESEEDELEEVQELVVEEEDTD